MSRPAEAASIEQDQKALFDKLAAEYERHYSDPWSQRYRETFFNAPMFGDMVVAGRRVLEALCGSGQTTVHLLSRGALVTGLDISAAQIELFKQRWPACEAVCGSIFDTGFEDESFDAVIVVLGLHHLHPDLDRAIDEIHRILKPGGYFCFVEPHTGSLPDVIRQIWYKVDTKLFQRNEAAVNLDALRARNADRFEFTATRYIGNVGYIFVLCSLVLRVPLALKRFYSPLLLKLESIIGRFQGKRLSCLAVCRWKKTGSRRVVPIARG